jgi:hypothetical protein
MCLLLTHPAGSRMPAPDLYVEIDQALAQPDDGRTIDVIVGNRGDAVNRENFDALLEVLVKGQPVCRAATNFVTPIAAGQSIRALRFELRFSNARPVEPYIVRGSIRYWDHTRSGTQKETKFALPPGRGRCTALKPVQ